MVQKAVELCEFDVTLRAVYFRGRPRFAKTNPRASAAQRSWLAEAKVRLESDRRRLDAMLEAAGLTVLGGTPLFRLVRHSEAMKIVERLGRNGIHVRIFPREPQWLRFGLPGDKQAWERLAAALSAK